MNTRQLVMMSLGSAIGTGLFVGTGAGVAAAGPAVLLSFLIAGTVVIIVMWALGEMAAANPNSGAFSVYAEKAMGPVAGATLGWLWWIQLVVVIAAEATASAAIIIGLWADGPPQWLLAFVFLVIFTGINLLGVGKFGEFEFWFATLKVLAIIAFLVVGIMMLVGILSPGHEVGFAMIEANGGFLPNGLGGVAAGLLVVIFAFGGTEIVTIAAAETEDPSRNVARAVKAVLWRILVFYIGSVTVMILVLPWNDPNMGTSPFVSVLSAANIPGADVIMAIIIVIALLSALSANLYGASRMVFSLSNRRLAPRVLSTTTKNGVPRAAVLASVAFGFITVVLNYLYPETILNALLNVVGATCLMVWGFALVSQLILRRRAEREGTALPLTMPGFPFVTGFGLVLLLGIFVLGFLNEATRSQLLQVFALVAGIAIVFAIVFAVRKNASSRD
nr:amino acid permease [Haematomicrobium sanguinis]